MADPLSWLLLVLVLARVCWLLVHAERVSQPRRMTHRDGAQRL